MDKIFKIGLLVMGLGYLAYLFGVGANVDTANSKATTTNEQVTNQVGRYELRQTGNLVSIMDTTNADIYMSSDINEWKKFNTITGKASIVKIVLSE